MVRLEDAPVRRRRGDTRERLLTAGARLFATNGYHGVSVEDLAAAVGVKGPAVYKHFASKEAVLAAMLVEISENLLAGGRGVAAQRPWSAATLAGLVAFHLDFAMGQPELIRVQERDLAALTPDQGRRVRRLQRAYVEVWVDVLAELVPGLAADLARLRVHAAFGLINSTPFSAPVRTAAHRSELERMALTALALPA